MSKIVISHAPINLSCPRCKTVLRLRRRPGDPGEFDCPDCRERLELVEEGDELRLRVLPPAVETKPKTRNAPVMPSVSFGALSARPRRWWSRARSTAARWAAEPLVVVWMIAAIAAVGIGVAFWQTRETPADGAKNALVDAHGAPSGESEFSDDVVADQRQRTVIQEPVEAPRGLAILRRPVEAMRPPASPPPDPRAMIADALAMKVPRFEQPTPAPFDLLRFQIEEVAGVAIRYDPSAGEDARDQTVTVALDDATLGEIIAEAAGQVGLEPVIDTDGVRLVPKASPTNESAPIRDDVSVDP